MKEKSLMINSIYSIIYKMINIVFPLFISVYASRVLLPEGMGKVIFAQNIVTYFTTIAALGIPRYGVKRIGAVQNNKEERNKIFSELFIVNFCSSIICMVLFLCFYSKNDYINGNKIVLIFSSLVILNIFNIDWLYQGLEEYKYITKRNLMTKCIAMIFLICFVRSKDDIYWYAWILCFVTVGNYFFNVINLHKYINFTIKNLVIRRHLKAIFILLASTCATEIYTMLDSTMVGVLCSETELSYYSNSVKVVRMLYVFTTAACAVYLPRLSFYFKEKKIKEFNELFNQGVKIVVLISIPCFVGVILLADTCIFVLFGVAYMPAIYTLRILSILEIVFSIAYMAGHSILIACNLEKYTLIAAISGAIVNLIGNIFLINLMGYNGAAISTVFSEIIVTIVLLFFTRKNVKYSIDKKYMLSVVIATFFMGIDVLLFKAIINHIFLELIVCVVSAIIVYFVILLVMKNSLVIMCVDFLRNALDRLRKE